MQKNRCQNKIEPRICISLNLGYNQMASELDYSNNSFSIVPYFRNWISIKIYNVLKKQDLQRFAGLKYFHPFR